MAIRYSTVHEAIAAAERILPGSVDPDGAEDPRWQAMIAIADFIQTEPEAVWSFARRWGSSVDDDLRTAVATVLLEHHFDIVIDRVEAAALSDVYFADTVDGCWRLGVAKEPTRAARFDRLISSMKRITPSVTRPPDAEEVNVESPRMRFYYRATCQTDDDAIVAHRCSGTLFDAVEGDTWIAYKRSGADVLYCFDDPEPIALQLAEVLRACGLFERVCHIDATDFDRATSDSV